MPPSPSAGTPDGVVVASVSKRFGATRVLDDVSFAVAKGGVTALIGRSGSGKSTLLRCINGLERIDGGRIMVGDIELLPGTTDLGRLRRRVGIVFQSFNLFPHMTAERNVTLALTVVKRMGRAEAQDRALRALQQVGLAEKRDAYPDQLSGGQQQRVAIARSLAMEPEVMLFDEVTSALDPELKEEVLHTMGGLAEQGMTMLLVTHEMRFARDVADQVVFMHQGRIWERGAPREAFAQPGTEELRRFLSYTM